MKETELILSDLEKTWLIDIDGTLVKHNGYLIDGRDTLLEGAKELIDSIPQKDVIILLTSRKKEYLNLTTDFLKENDVRFDRILFGLPVGERIIINDVKPKGLKTAVAVNVTRDEKISVSFRESSNI